MGQPPMGHIIPRPTTGNEGAHFEDLSLRVFDGDASLRYLARHGVYPAILLLLIPLMLIAMVLGSSQTGCFLMEALPTVWCHDLSRYLGSPPLDVPQGTRTSAAVSACARPGITRHGPNLGSDAMPGIPTVARAARSIHRHGTRWTSNV